MCRRQIAYGKSVPGVTTVVEDVRIGPEDAVGQPIVAHELPDILDRIELGALGWQGDNGDVRRDDKLMRKVPSRWSAPLGVDRMDDLN